MTGLPRKVPPCLSGTHQDYASCVSGDVCLAYLLHLTRVCCSHCQVCFLTHYLSLFINIFIPHLYFYVVLMDTDT